MIKGLTGLDQIHKGFIKTFQELTRRHQSWQVWSDFVYMAACAISNSVDKSKFEERERAYLDVIGRYDSKEQKIFRDLFNAVVQALDTDPEQDFLGSLFMQLELGNHWKGQFFTPYNVCRLVGDIEASDLRETIKQKGFVSVNDPACGAGAMLIGFANTVRGKGVNYQNHVLFVGQDIDQTAALMCYIQLSLLGCPGYVVIGDTLSKPVTSVLSGRDVWYTPMFFSQVWHWRRVFKKIDDLINPVQTPPQSEPEVRGNRTSGVRERTKGPDKTIQMTLF